MSSWGATPPLYHGSLVGRAGVRGGRAAAVVGLKETPGEDILIYGSSTLVNTLLPHKLIDEYRFMIFPVVLGTGQRFFSDAANKSILALKRAETSGTGVTMLVCEPAP